MEEPLESDIPSEDPPEMRAMQILKMKEQCVNVTENKGSRLENRAESGNVAENKGSYTPHAGMSLKIKGIIGKQRATRTSNQLSRIHQRPAGDGRGGPRSRGLPSECRWLPEVLNCNGCT
jgi:hypothetical protein